MTSVISIDRASTLLSLSLSRLFKKSQEIDNNVNTKDEDRDKLKKNDDSKGSIRREGKNGKKEKRGRRKNKSQREREEEQTRENEEKAEEKRGAQGRKGETGKRERREWRGKVSAVDIIWLVTA